MENCFPFSVKDLAGQWHTCNIYLSQFLKGINFCEETYFKYFTRIKFSKFHQKHILAINVFFCSRLKKVFAMLTGDKGN